MSPFVGSGDGLDEFVAVPDLEQFGQGVDVDRRPSRCLPTESCCQATVITPLTATLRVIHSSPSAGFGERFEMGVEVGAGRSRSARNRFGGWLHADALVGPVGVVVGDPGVEFGLGAGEVVEHAPGEELDAQGAVEPFDLAGRGR